MLKTGLPGTSLAVQQLRLCASTAGRGADSIPGRGTKIPACHVVQPESKQTNKQKTGLLKDLNCLREFFTSLMDKLLSTLHVIFDFKNTGFKGSNTGFSNIC